jgi:hypothetical protein
MFGIFGKNNNEEEEELNNEEQKKLEEVFNKISKNNIII